MILFFSNLITILLIISSCFFCFSPSVLRVFVNELTIVCISPLVISIVFLLSLLLLISFKGIRSLWTIIYMILILLMNISVFYFSFFSDAYLEGIIITDHIEILKYSNNFEYFKLIFMEVLNYYYPKDFIASIVLSGDAFIPNVGITIEVTLDSLFMEFKGNDYFRTYPFFIRFYDPFYYFFSKQYFLYKNFATMVILIERFLFLCIIGSLFYFLFKKN